MINYVAERYKELRPTNKRMKKGLFNDIINEAKMKYGDACDTIPIKTI